MHLKVAFQQHIREAEALKLELGRAEETLRAASGVAAPCADGSVPTQQLCLLQRGNASCGEACLKPGGYKQ